MKLKPIIPANVDPIKLADEIKRGMSTKFFEDVDEIRKGLKSHLGKQF